METEDYIVYLEQEHRKLDEKIEKLFNDLGCKDEDIQEMKKERLKLKDKIERLRREIK